MAMLSQQVARIGAVAQSGENDSDAMRTGAFLFVLERNREPAILAAIRAAFGTEIALYPGAVRSRLRPTAARKCSPVPVEKLTRREVDVLRLLAQGNTNRQTAGLLGLSIRTVENHRANLIGKLGVASRAEIVSYAAEHDLV